MSDAAVWHKPDDLRRMYDEAVGAFQATSAFIESAIAGGEGPQDEVLYLRALGKLIKAMTKYADAVKAERDTLMLGVPNLPHPLAPVSRTPAS